MSKIYYIIYLLIDSFFSLLGMFPLSYSKKISNLLGRGIAYLDSRHNKVATKNLKNAFRDKVKKCGRNKIIVRVYKNFLKLIFEVFWARRNTFDKIKSHVVTNGFSNLKKVYAKNKGVLIISAHIGAWELLPFILSKMGLIINIVYRPLDFLPLDIFVKDYRSVNGNRLLDKKSSKDKIIKALSSGECVGLIIDQSANWYDGVWVKFFGQNSCTSNGVAKLFVNLKVPVIPIFMIRVKNKYKIFFEKELSLIKFNDGFKSMEKNTLNYTKSMENIIKVCPDQWFWLHNRWKNKPYCVLNSSKIGC